MENKLIKNLLRVCVKVKSGFLKRDPNLWVFGEWMGNRICDNSLYFVNYIAQNHPEIKPVWISKKNVDTILLDPSVHRVEMDTTESQEVLKRAGVAIMNQGRVDFSVGADFNCDGAITVNLWHGVPWKLIGADMARNQKNIQKIKTVYAHWIQKPTLTVALSEDFAQIIGRAFFVKDGNVIRTGYPRNSIFYNSETMEKCRTKAMNLLYAQGLAVTDNTKIITYMPTFRDNTQDVFSFKKLDNDPKLCAILQKHNAVIVQRAHFVSSQRNAETVKTDNSRITALDEISSQELLAATDLLITDYSSCFFDYLVLDRPIIHYLYDYEYYANEDRGLYYKKEDVVCGDVAVNEDELLRFLDENLNAPEKNATLRKERKEKYMTYESKDGCRIIYEEILKRLK